jgi:hypothetical protein
VEDDNNDTILLHYGIYYVRKKFYDHSYELSDAFVINLICINSVKILILLPTILAWMKPKSRVTRLGKISPFGRLIKAKIF